MTEKIIDIQSDEFIPKCKYSVDGLHNFKRINIPVNFRSGIYVEQCINEYCETKIRYDTSD